MFPYKNTGGAGLHANEHRAESDSALANSAGSFAGINFVFPGLSLPFKGMRKRNRSIGALHKPKQHFLLAFQWSSLSKIFDSAMTSTARSRIFPTLQSNIFAEIFFLEKPF